MKNLSPQNHRTVSFYVAVSIVALVTLGSVLVAKAAFTDPHEETIKNLQELYAEVESEANDYKAQIDQLTVKYNESIRKLQLINQAANNTRELVELGK